MKQSIILHLNRLASSFNFSKFHPSPSDSSGRPNLEVLYHEHYFWESSSNLDFGDFWNQNFSWDDATLTINDIIQSVDLFNRGEKIILLGKRGCGMSTALLRAAFSQSQIGFYDFILFLDETCVEFKPEHESFMISFGKQTVSLFEFCSIYGKYTLIIFDNAESFPLNSMEVLTNNENLRETTILCSFQSHNSSPKVPTKLFDRFYISSGFSINNFKSIGRKMLGSLWAENLFLEILKKLNYDNDVMSLSVITALIHRNCNLGTTLSQEDCYEKFVNFLIIQKMKKELSRKQAPVSAEETSRYSVSLQQSAISRYSENRSYSDKELLSELSLTLRLFLMKLFIKNVQKTSEKNRILESLEDICPHLSEDLKDMLKQKKNNQPKVIITSNKLLKEFFCSEYVGNSAAIEVLVNLKEIHFTRDEIESWKNSINNFENFQIRLENMQPYKLHSILSKIKTIQKLSLSFRNISADNNIQRANSTQSIPAKDLLQDFSNYSLKQITFHDIPCQLLIDHFLDVLSGSSATGSLNKFSFRRLNIDFSHAYQLKEFEQNLFELSKQLPFLVFEIENCTFNVPGINRNIGLVVLGVFATSVDITDLIDVSQDPKFSFYAAFKHDSLDNLILTFQYGRLNEVVISGTIISQSCPESTEICKLLKFKPFSSKLDCSNLNIMCKNARCPNCSSLLILEGVCQSGFSRVQLYKPRTVDFGPKNFLHENVTFLTENLSPIVQKTASSQITVKFAGLIFGSEVATNEMLNETFGPGISKPAMFSSFAKLKSQNVVFEMETKEKSTSVESDDESMIICPGESPCEVLDIEVDNTGWGFTRFNLTQDPITVSFSNGVTIEWPSNSTVESRIVCVEVHVMPQDIINRVCTAKQEPVCMLSPFLFIDQVEDKPFLQHVTVTMPYSGSNEKAASTSGLQTRVFSYRDGNVKQWQTVVDQSKYELKENVFKYISKTFSPVGAVTNAEESSLNPTDFWEVYLPESVYLIVCPSQNDTKIIFDCRKFRNEDEHKKLKTTAGARFRKLNEMHDGDLIYGSIAGNLIIDESYGYSLREDKKLVFYYPDPEHESNKQEYKMKILSRARDPEGTITYYKVQSVETSNFHKLFHLKLELQFTPVNFERPGYKRKTSCASMSSPKKMATQYSGSNLVLTYDTLKEVVAVCGKQWPELLEKLNMERGKIAEIMDHNVSDAFLRLRGKFKSKMMN